MVGVHGLRRLVALVSTREGRGSGGRVLLGEELHMLVGQGFLRFVCRSGPRQFR